MTTTVIICFIGIALPYTGVGRILGFRSLPWAYWPLLAAMLGLYAVSTHWAKMRFVRRWGM